MRENCVFMLVLYTEFACLLTTYILILTTLAVKQCMGIGVGLICVEGFNLLMLVLTLADDLCCAWFIYPILCW
jgi:hypothetical protein